jgi:cytochrome c oxidase subunit 2
MQMPHTSVLDPHSPQAQSIARLFYIDLAISAAIFLLVTGLVAFAAWRFRARPGDPEPHQESGVRWLETLWTAIPTLIVLVLLVLTAQTMLVVNPPVGKRKPDVTVVAHQWWWEYRYGDPAVVAANELHMPLGENWLLLISSADVIHDFWVPDLGAKMDAIPGHPGYLWIQPRRAGTFLGTCAEYCGADHATMGIRVVVEPPADFAAWRQHQARPPVPPSDAAGLRGGRLFAARTCRNCHAIAGTAAHGGVGPDLSHLGERATLAAGVLPNTPDDLRRWLLDPQHFKPGCHMPDEGLTDAEARDLASYLEGLR